MSGYDDPSDATDDRVFHGEDGNLSVTVEGAGAREEDVDQDFESLLFELFELFGGDGQ